METQVGPKAPRGMSKEEYADDPPEDAQHHRKLLLSKEGSSSSSDTRSSVDSLGDTTISREERKLGAVKSIVERDPLGADARWSFFAAAFYSHRYATCADPYPPMGNGVKDLAEVVDRVPPLTAIKSLVAGNVLPSTMDLLHWVLSKLDEIRVRHVSKGNLSDLIHVGQMCGNVQEPHLIFQIISKPHSPRDLKWQNMVRGRKTFFAFHGNKLDSFHSIIHKGFKHFTEAHDCTLFLSNSLQQSLKYSPPGYGLGASLIGPRMHCVALCEVVEHPDVKPRQRPRNDPLKVFKVLDADLVCVRYLLLYKDPPIEETIIDNTHTDLLFRVKFFCLLVLYVALVSYIWLAH